MEKLPMTKEGFQKLKEELDRMKRVERPQALQAMNEAAAHGDISDNADYRVAKERRDFIEGRIKELDDKLARAQIIDTRDLATDKVVFGCTVLLAEVRGGPPGEVPDRRGGRSGHPLGPDLGELPCRQGAHRPSPRRDCPRRGALRGEGIRNFGNHE